MSIIKVIQEQYHWFLCVIMWHYIEVNWCHLDKSSINILSLIIFAWKGLLITSCILGFSFDALRNNFSQNKLKIVYMCKNEVLTIFKGYSLVRFQLVAITFVLYIWWIKKNSWAYNVFCMLMFIFIAKYFFLIDRSKILLEPFDLKLISCFCKQYHILWQKDSLWWMPFFHSESF
jgi:hypothetical protein